jgi:hypothetical protein
MTNCSLVDDIDYDYIASDKFVKIDEFNDAKKGRSIFPIFRVRKVKKPPRKFRTKVHWLNGIFLARVQEQKKTLFVAL